VSSKFVGDWPPSGLTAKCQRIDCHWQWNPLLWMYCIGNILSWQNHQNVAISQTIVSLCHLIAIVDRRCRPVRSLPSPVAVKYTDMQIANFSSLSKHQCRMVVTERQSTPTRTPSSLKMPVCTPSTEAAGMLFTTEKDSTQCYNCNKQGHVARYFTARQSTAAADLKQEESDEYQEEATVCLPWKVSSSSASKEKVICCVHDRNMCPKCIVVSPAKHRCQALEAVSRLRSTSSRHCWCLLIGKQMSKDASRRRSHRR